MQSRKHTAWKKNRKFGDVMGGRHRPKLADNIFNRQHNLTPPTDGTEKPIFMMDNSSRDFYFPVTVDEVKGILGRLPDDQTNHLTHVWFQTIKKTDYLAGKTFQGCFICGNGVYLIVLHPFPIDLKMRFSKIKPTNKVLNYYKEFSAELKEDQYGWYLQWTEASIKKYYLENLLLHQIGRSIDSFYKRYWSKATEQKRDNWADNYVAVWADQVRDEY